MGVSGSRPRQTGVCFPRSSLYVPSLPRRGDPAVMYRYMGRQSTGLLQPSPRRAEECQSQTGNISLCAPSSPPPKSYVHTLCLL